MLANELRAVFDACSQNIVRSRFHSCSLSKQNADVSRSYINFDPNLAMGLPTIQNLLGLSLKLREISQRFVRHL